jgi:aryl-alcohol dehydrogenase-like predicted oxidoreductase
MEQRILGNSLSVSCVGLGCMGMSEFYGSTDESESIAVLHKAVELGVDFLDTADMYGPFKNEELIGKFIKQTKAPIKVATKFGIVRDGNPSERNINNSASYIKQSCESSLQRLGVDCIDLYYVHRLDQNSQIEDVINTLSILKQEGKINHIGLCEVNANTLRQANAVHQITALQTEYSIWTREVESEILPTCKELGIGFVAYSPLGRGFLTGKFDKNTINKTDFRQSLPRFQKNNLESNQKILEGITTIAKQIGISESQVALAWLLTKDKTIVPIPGTKRIRYLEENCKASVFELTDEQMSYINTLMERHPVAGNRYTDLGMTSIQS